MNKILIAAALGATVLGGHTVEAKALRPCPGTVVTIDYGSSPRCDVSPPQRLDVVFARRNAPARYRRAWGGDASLAWATETCLDYGGVPVWHNGTWMRCKRVDY